MFFNLKSNCILKYKNYQYAIYNRSNPMRTGSPIPVPWVYCPMVLHPLHLVRMQYCVFTNIRQYSNKLLSLILHQRIIVFLPFFHLFKLPFISPLDIFTDAFTFLSGKKRKDGKHQLTIPMPIMSPLPAGTKPQG